MKMEPKRTSKSRRKRIFRIILTFIAVAAWMVFGGIAQFVHRGYSPFVQDLDELSELSITTYPAWFPSEVVDVPFFYKKLVSPDSVYFQVFVRDKQRKSGPNPHIESIMIQSFLYRFGSGPATELIVDYDRSFWMQNNPEDAQPLMDLKAIPYIPNGVVSIEIALILNGESYRLQGNLPAEERTRTYPLFLYRLR